MAYALESSPRPTAIDLFSGAGGLSVGLEQAGFDVRLGLDFDRHALATYAANHSGKALHADVKQVSGKDLLTEAGLSSVDLLAGGPSCQGFSTHGKRIAEDPRNFLYVEFMRIVGEIKPTTVLIENVKGLLSTGKGAYKREIFESFESLGYSIDARILHAADFGVPQMRHRVFFVASLAGDSLRLPVGSFAPPESPDVNDGFRRAYRTLGEAIGDMPEVGVDDHAQAVDYAAAAKGDLQRALRSKNSKLWNHVSRPLSPLAESVVKHISPGNGLRSLSPADMPDRFKKMRRIANGELRKDCTTLYHRLSYDSPAYTITCNFRNVSSGAFTHPTQNRSITPREAARIQTFPDDFKFVGASIPRQIGNAVPPMLAKAVGQSIIGHLRSVA